MFYDVLHGLPGQKNEGRRPRPGLRRTLPSLQAARATIR